MKRLMLLSIAALAMAACSDSATAPTASLDPSTPSLGVGDPPPPPLRGKSIYGATGGDFAGFSIQSATAAATSAECTGFDFTFCVTTEYSQNLAHTKEFLTFFPGRLPKNLEQAIRHAGGSICEVSLDPYGFPTEEDRCRPRFTNRPEIRELRLAPFSSVGASSKGEGIVFDKRDCNTFDPPPCQPGQIIVATVDLRQFNRAGGSIACFPPDGNPDLTSVETALALGQTWISVRRRHGHGNGHDDDSDEDSDSEKGGKGRNFVEGDTFVSSFFFTPSQVVGASCHENETHSED